MIKGIGIDLIEIDRVAAAVENTEGFLEKMFTGREIEYFRSRKMKAETIAGNFAAKEAFVKAVGTGFVGIDTKGIEVLRDEMGAPYVNILKEEMRSKMDGLKIFVSISHSKTNAVAQVIIEG